jgi:sigma-B regulation protein RsbU (phosphoserine phosphatase)
VVLDLDSGAVAYCNAGHEPLLLRRADGRVLVLDEGGGPPLCVAEFAGYRGAKAQLAAGDVLVLASDGLTEATDPEGALFGRGALRECVAAADGGDVDALGRSILGAIAAFEAGAEPGDDQTLLLLRWNGPARAG